MSNKAEFEATVDSIKNIKSNEITSESLNQGLRSRLDFEESWSDRFAFFLTNSFGTVWFLIANAVFFLVWIVWNTNIIPGVRPFDPFPYGFLTMIVSLVAIFLSVIVLIAQNRQGRIADIRQQIDFEINVRAEHEITKVLEILCDIQTKLGIQTKDIELQEMIEKTNLEELKEQVEDVVDRVEAAVAEDIEK